MESHSPKVFLHESLEPFRVDNGLGGPFGGWPENRLVGGPADSTGVRIERAGGRPWRPADRLRRENEARAEREREHARRAAVAEGGCGGRV